ncbi:hypothetical protein [Streptomyces lydicus]
MEWINPKYAEVVASMQKAAENGDDEDAPIRGFLIPGPEDAKDE